MVVSFRVFKKASPNNKVTIYLGRRDFIDHVTESDPIDGVLLIDKEYLQGRQVNSCSYILTSVSKKLGQSAVMYYYCALSQFFETDFNLNVHQ